MFLKSLKIINVRIHKHSQYEFSDENILTGDNGAGKTTVLESIYLLSSMRGFKKQPLSSVVSFGESFMRIEAEMIMDNSSSIMSLKYDGKKNIFIDKTPVEKISDFIYDFPVSCYTPDSPGILSQSQSDRRSFIDRHIFYTDKSHLEDLRLYNRLIMQKNAILEKDDKEDIDFDYLDVLNEKITILANTISGKRKYLIGEINKELQEIYSSLSFPMETVLLSYKTNINNKDIIRKEFLKKKSEYGIHRDKIEMCLDSKVIEKFSSIGQKKTFVLLCLYASLKNVEKKRKSSIITLLDDFEATLDKKRAFLLKDIFSNERQTIFTGVEPRINFKNIINII